MNKIENLEKIAAQVRRDIIRMVHAAQSGHPGGSLGCADLITALFFEVFWTYSPLRNYLPNLGLFFGSESILKNNFFDSRTFLRIIELWF